jgi:alkylation response protein AidB-like acyl-CoA dehydrogenase
MSLPDRNNPYSFNEYLAWRQSVDYWADDPFLQKVVAKAAGDDFGRIEKIAQEVSQKASFFWRDLAETAARPENRPFMMHYDGHNNRIDRIVRPMETLTLEKEVFGLGLFSAKRTPLERMVITYLTSQNSESCIMCPITCTEGLVAVIEQCGGGPQVGEILTHMKEGKDGEFAIGAQYLSEIQGGSDVPANVLEAVPEGDHFRLYGKKFFCSATHADYAAVTAKPVGSERVALFVVPSWLPGNKEKEIRNSQTIDRIKWKMGTSELTTAEITYNGAVAYPIGPLNRGLANAVGIVLALSRLNIGLWSGAGMARASREANRYASFRTAFGLPINVFPMLQNQLLQMEHEAKRATAGAFKLNMAFYNMPGGVSGGLGADEPLETKKKRFELRIMIMLQKIATAKDSVEMGHLAMSVFGGHGVMEDFSQLPRFFRDGVVNELWEGPRNVLLTQMHRDFQRAAAFYAPEDFVKSVLKGADERRVSSLANELEELIAHPSLLDNNQETRLACIAWDNYCDKLFHAFQDQSLVEIE